MQTMNEKKLAAVVSISLRRTSGKKKTLTGIKKKKRNSYALCNKERDNLRK